MKLKYNEQPSPNVPPVGLSKIKTGWGVREVLDEARMVMSDGQTREDILPALEAACRVLDKECKWMHDFIESLK